MSFRTPLISFVIAAGSCALSQRANGFALEGKTWPAGASVVMHMQLGTPSKPLQDGSTTWNIAVAPSPGDWDAVMRHVQLQQTDSSAPVSSGDGVNSVEFSSTVFGDSFGSGVLAITYYLSSGSTMKEADILFNKAQTFDSYRGNLQFDSQGNCICDIRRVFLHELGHALGLAHPDDAGQHVDAVMNSVISNDDALTADDIAGVQSLYGAPEVAPTPTPAPTATPTGPSRLVNLSTRMKVGTGDNVLIGGFIIVGDVQKTVLLRGIGPSLGASGISGALQDPQMSLLDANGNVLQTNDNWQDSPNVADITASGIPPTDPRESAIFARLGPGNYTVIVSGVNNTTGIGMVENYTLDTYEGSHVANISTRGQVGLDDAALIGGFIVRGSTTKKILVRALGPSLTGIAQVVILQNPSVELVDTEGQVLMTNDDWQNSTQVDDIRATGIPPTDSRESALIATLGPGNYTTIVTGNGGVGLGLVEIYDLDQ